MCFCVFFTSLAVFWFTPIAAGLLYLGIIIISIAAAKEAIN